MILIPYIAIIYKLVINEGWRDMFITFCYNKYTVRLGFSLRIHLSCVHGLSCESLQCLSSKTVESGMMNLFGIVFY